MISIIWLALTIFENVQTNMQAQGITSGFGFLDDTAGFNIIMHLVDYEESSSYLDAFWVGLLNTLLVSALGIVLATIFGFIIGIIGFFLAIFILAPVLIYILSFFEIIIGTHIYHRMFNPLLRSNVFYLYFVLEVIIVIIILAIYKRIKEIIITK